MRNIHKLAFQFLIKINLTLECIRIIKTVLDVYPIIEFDEYVKKVK